MSSDPDVHGDEEEGEQEFPISDELIDEDMPCLRCTYNLRGLKPVGQCPECGARIEKTLAYVMQRVLCPTCLRPNHPTAALCVHCKQPIHGAASTANYFRPTALVPRSGEARDDDQPDPPSLAWSIICCAFVVLVATMILPPFMVMWTEPAGPLESEGGALFRKCMVTLVVSPAFLIMAMIVYVPLRNYRRARRVYLAKMSTMENDEELTELAKEAEAAEPEGGKL